MLIFRPKVDDDLPYYFDFAPRTNAQANPKCGVDWTQVPCDWLDPGERINSYTLTVSAGLNKHDESLINNQTVIKVFLTGNLTGTPTGMAGNSYLVKCAIETTAVPPRKVEKEFMVTLR